MVRPKGYRVDDPVTTKGSYSDRLAGATGFGPADSPVNSRVLLAK